MAIADVKLLHPKMVPFVEDWKRTCPVPVLIYCTVRESWEQAVLYARGRTAEEIAKGVARLERLGLNNEAILLARQSPQPGWPRVTAALPGLSFHQSFWIEGAMGGLALDFVPVFGGKPQWDDLDAYRTAGQAAENVGLTWSGRWKRFRETCHLQYDGAGTMKIVDLARRKYL